MQNATHTPGPWVHHNGIIGHSDTQVIKNDDRFDWVASVQVSNVPEWEANARLIVAAPELLKALEKFLAVYGPDRTQAEIEPNIKQMIAAVKKAKGE